MIDLIPASFFDFLKILDDQKISYVLMGGLAFGLWTEPRFTHDADLTIALDVKKWEELKVLLETHPSIKIRQMTQDPDFQVPYLVRIFYETYPVDLLVAVSPVQDSLIERRLLKECLGRMIPVATAEDLIVGKLIAARTRDLSDVIKLLKMNSNLDFSYIEKWVKVWELEKIWEDVLEESKKEFY